MHAQFCKRSPESRKEAEALETALGQQGTSSPQWALSTQQRWDSGLRLEEESSEDVVSLQCCCWITDFSTGPSAWSMYTWQLVAAEESESCPAIQLTPTTIRPICNSTQEFWVLFFFHSFLNCLREESIQSKKYTMQNWISEFTS